MNFRHLLAAMAAATLAQSVVANDIPVEGGTGDGANCFPFGCTYNGIYQQVYSASEFGSLTDFDTLTFYADQSPAFSGLSNIGTYTIDFYYSANPVDGLSGIFADNFGASIGSLGTFSLNAQPINSTNNLVFNGSTLTYDPTQGDLLMSINASSVNTGRIFLDSSSFNGDTVSRAFNPSSYVDGRADSIGLVTGFSLQGVSSGVPEPSTWAMLLLGFFAIGGVIRSKRRDQKVSVRYG